MSADDNDNRANPPQHPTDWDAQRERLSAYLDGQLNAAERAALERHLPTCARCAEELADLRRTVALLRALPTPALPRSFALPADVPARAPAASAAEPTALPRPGAPAPARAPRWAGLAQWAGGLAAAAGIVLVLGSTLSGGGVHLASSALSGGASNAHTTTADAPYGAGAQTPTHAPAPTGTQQSVTTLPCAPTAGVLSPTPVVISGCTAQIGHTTPTPSATPAIRTPAPTVGGNGHFGAQTADGAGSGPPVLPLAGGGLAIGGGLVFVLGRRARRRAA